MSEEINSDVDWHNPQEAGARIAEEAKRRLVLWILTAVSGVGCTLAGTLGYWGFGIAVQARDHLNTPHFYQRDHLEYDRELRIRMAEVAPEIAREQMRHLLQDLKSLESRVQRLEARLEKGGEECVAP